MSRVLLAGLISAVAVAAVPSAASATMGLFSGCTPPPQPCSPAIRRNTCRRSIAPYRNRDGLAGRRHRPSRARAVPDRDGAADRHSLAEACSISRSRPNTVSTNRASRWFRRATATPFRSRRATPAVGRLTAGKQARNLHRRIRFIWAAAGKLSGGFHLEAPPCRHGHSDLPG